MTEVKRASDESGSEIRGNRRKQNISIFFSATSKRLCGLGDGLPGLLIEREFTDDSRKFFFFFSLFQMSHFPDEGGASGGDSLQTAAVSFKSGSRDAAPEV